MHVQSIVKSLPVYSIGQGAGKTTLAKRLAAVWKCQLVDGKIVICYVVVPEVDICSQLPVLLNEPFVMGLHWVKRLV